MIVIPKVDYEGSSQSTVKLLSTAEGFAGVSAWMRLPASVFVCKMREPLESCNAMQRWTMLSVLSLSLSGSRPRPLVYRTELGSSVRNGKVLE